jgi:hypothetical protein
MSNKRLYLKLASLSSTVALISPVALAQSGSVMPGPTGAPKTAPPIILSPRTPPLGGPVVLEPPTTNPPRLPRGARDALQGRVALKKVPQRTRYQTCAPLETSIYRPFATITGKIQKGSTLEVTVDCYGALPDTFGLMLVSGSQWRTMFLIDPEEPSSNSNWQAFSFLGSPSAPTVFKLPISGSVDPTVQPVIPPKTVILDVGATSNVSSYLHFRAILTQQNIDTLNSGGTLTNPPANL